MSESAKFVKLVCRECGNVEELPLNVVFGRVVIRCSSCGGLIVETKTSPDF